MTTTDTSNHKPSVGRTVLRFTSILVWLSIMLYASYEGLFIHSYLGLLAIGILTVLMVRRASARARTLHRKRENFIQGYEPGEKYLEVFMHEHHA